MGCTLNVGTFKFSACYGYNMCTVADRIKVAIQLNYICISSKNIFHLRGIVRNYIIIIIII